MNHLLACTTEGHFVVGGINDLIIGGQFDCQNSLVELVRSSAQGEQQAAADTPNNAESKQHEEDAKKEKVTTEKEKKKQQHQKKQAEELALLNKCQSVAIYTSSGGDVVYYAVARGDKTLSIYQHRKSNKPTTENESSATRLQPILIYNTPKRVGCMSFVTLDGNGNENDAVVILVTGDMAGDSYAYWTTIQQQSDDAADSSSKTPSQRHLLGHTASTLTGVLCCTTTTSSNNTSRRRLLTCDRDEKIRVSTFPETYEICGYLLGHEEYITAMALVPSSSSTTQVISCSCDQTLRLWDLESLQQKAVCDLVQQEEEGSTATEQESQTQLVPTALSVSDDGLLIAVVYDQSRQLDIFQLSPSGPNKDGAANDNGMEIIFLQRIQCPSLPLGVTFQQNVLVVLLQEPHVLTEYVVVHKESAGNEKSSNNSIVEQTTTRLGTQALRDMVEKYRWTLPATILEKDKHGQPTMQKTGETRGPSGDDAPWNRVERVDKARERNKRSKKRRAERKVPESSKRPAAVVNTDA